MIYNPPLIICLDGQKTAAFGTLKLSKVFLLTGMPAHNRLKVICHDMVLQEALEPKKATRSRIKTVRIKTVRNFLILMSCRVVSHARWIFMPLGCREVGHRWFAASLLG